MNLGDIAGMGNWALGGSAGLDTKGVSGGLFHLWPQNRGISPKFRAKFAEKPALSDSFLTISAGIAGKMANPYGAKKAQKSVGAAAILHGEKPAYTKDIEEKEGSSRKSVRFFRDSNLVRKGFAGLSLCLALCHMRKGRVMNRQ